MPAVLQDSVAALYVLLPVVLPSVAVANGRDSVFLHVALLPLSVGSLVMANAVG